MNQTRTCYTECSKSEREKEISYINTYIWNLQNGIDEPTCRERNGNTDVENRLLDIVREGESGMNGESSINTYILPCVK